MEADLFKIKVLQQGMTQMADADDDEAVAFVNAQNMPDLRAKLGYIVAVSLLAELTEAAQILADLRGGDVHFAAQRIGGNTHDAFIIQVVQIAVIAGKTMNDGIRYFLLFHKSVRSFSFAFDYP